MKTLMFDEYMKQYNMSKDWSMYDPAGCEVPYPTDLDLIKARRMVYLRYFLRNPAYVWKTLCQTDLRSIFSFMQNASQVLWRQKPSQL